MTGNFFKVNKTGPGPIVHQNVLLNIQASLKDVYLFLQIGQNQMDNIKIVALQIWHQMNNKKGSK